MQPALALFILILEYGGGYNAFRDTGAQFIADIGCDHQNLPRQTTFAHGAQHAGRIEGIDVDRAQIGAIVQQLAGGRIRHIRVIDIIADAKQVQRHDLKLLAKALIDQLMNADACPRRSHGDGLRAIRHQAVDQLRRDSSGDHAVVADVEAPQLRFNIVYGGRQIYAAIGTAAQRLVLARQHQRAIVAGGQNMLQRIGQKPFRFGRIGSAVVVAEIIHLYVEIAQLAPCVARALDKSRMKLRKAGERQHSDAQLSPRQRTRQQIRLEAQLFRRFQHLRARFLLHAGLSVQRAVYRGRRYAQFPCDIVDRRPFFHVSSRKSSCVNVKKCFTNPDLYATIFAYMM